MLRLKIKKIRHLLLCLIVIMVCLQSCNPSPDPSFICETAPCPQLRWKTPCHFVMPVDRPLLGIEDGEKKLTLCDLIDVSLKNNPRTQLAWRQARSAAYQVGARESQLYPNLTYFGSINLLKIHSNNATGFGVLNNGGRTTNNPDQNTVDPNNPNTDPLNINPLEGLTAFAVPRDDYSQVLIHNLALTYLLLDFGGRFADIEASKLALHSANWNHNQMIQNVILDVLNAYYAHENAVANLKARELDLKDAKVNFESAKAQFEAGVRNKVDVLQAQSNLANAELNLETYRGRVKTTMGQLATALGIPANSQLNVEPLPDTLPSDTIKENVEELMAMAKAERPDLQASYADFLQKQAQIRVADSAGRPTLQAIGSAQSYGFIHQPILNNRFVAGGLMLQVPLFDGFLRRHQVRRAKEDARAAYETYEDKQENVYLDVVRSYYDFKTAIEAVKYSEDLYAYSDESYKATLEAYNSGVASIVELLNTQASLADARSRRIESRTQFVTALANIAYSTGTL